MKNLKGMQLFAISVMFLFLGDAKGIVEANNSRGAAALFPQFETVFGAKAGLLLGSDDHDFVRAPFALLFEGLKALNEQAPKEVLGNADEVLVGTKDYLPPAGLGMVRSTFCYVVALKTKNGLSLDRYFKNVVPSSAGVVWNWSASLEEFGENDPRASSLYAAVVAQSYLLVSNNLEELEYVATRLKSSEEDNARGLAGIRKWEDIRQHAFWGYRRYRHNRVLSKVAAGMGTINPAVEALTLYADSRQGKGVLQLLSSGTDARIAEEVNATKVMSSFVPHGSGVWQAVVPLTYDDKNRADMNSIFAMRWLFGFGAVI